MEFEMISINDVSNAVLYNFDCGNYVFNEFLQEKAKKWQAQGEAVTYVFVEKSDICASDISRIYGYSI